MMMLVIVFLMTLSYASGATPTTGYERQLANEPVKSGDHPCFRPCQDGLQHAKICHYTFYVGWYYTMSKACGGCPFNVTDCAAPHCITADGVERAVVVANKMLPGPDIQVCEKDIIEVEVHNSLEGGEATTIHWHGVHQKGTPWMDGVAMLTQCPILGHTSFKYKFEAQNAGTHFWHSHTGLQRGDGLFGSLVIRSPPSTDPVNHYYDYDLAEHVVLVTDWLLELTVSKFAHHHHDDGDNKPKSMLINGKGVYANFTHPANGTIVAQTPREVFNVTSGKKYRFRMISSSILYCPIRISVDDHTLRIIAMDGNPVQPYEVESFVMYAGERMDFVLDANQAAGNYWMRAKGLADCSVKFAHQEAIIRYGGAPFADPPGNPDWAGLADGHQLNPWNMAADSDHVPITMMNATAPDDATLQQTPDAQFFFSMDFNKVDNWHYNDPRYYPLYTLPRGKHLYTPQMNHTSFVLPNAPPLTQFGDVDKDLLCSDGHNHGTNCSEEYCACTYNVNVKLGDVVEMIIVDEGVTFAANHPMHLHGYSFRVVAIEKLGEKTTLEEVMRLDREGKIKRKLHNAPLKDSVTVPDGGYTVLRFTADNPGIWLMHCHIAFHAEIGMSFTVSVGEPSTWPRPPPNFPRCGNFDVHPQTSFVPHSKVQQCLDSLNNGAGAAWSTYQAVVLLLSVLYASL